VKPLAARIQKSLTTLQLLEFLGQASLDWAMPTSEAAVLARNALISRAKAVLRRHGEPSVSGLSDEQLAALAALAERNAAHRDAVVAEAMLTAFDETLGDKLWLAFQGEQRVIDLAPGSPFPLPFHNLKERFPQGSIAARPDSQQNLYGRRRYVDVFPKAHRYHARMDFSRPALLSTFLLRPTLAIALPNSSCAELVYSEAHGTFFDVRPRDYVKQVERFEQLLELADREGAAAALLPELSVTEALAADLGQWLERRSSPEGLRLLVAGSYHWADRMGNGANRAELRSSHSRTAHHDKISPYELKAWEGRQLPRPLRERIAGIPLLTVHWCDGGWSVVTLICKDLLDAEVISLLVRLRPSFVLVVSFSDNTANFESNATYVASQCQSTVVVCNFPGGQNQAFGAFVAAPVTVNGALLTERVPGVQLLGRLAIFNLRSSTLLTKIVT